MLAAPAPSSCSEHGSGPEEPHTQGRGAGTIDAD